MLLKELTGAVPGAVPATLEGQLIRKLRFCSRLASNMSRERPKGIDGKVMISKCGWEMKKKQCVYGFFFFQPGVVSTCSVTERISFVHSFAAVFRKGVLEFVWNLYLVGPFLRHVSKGTWGCDCWLFGQSLVCHFLENSTPAFFSTLTVFLILHIGDKR